MPMYSTRSTLASSISCLWGALQGGSWGNQTQHAAAFVGEAGWQPPVTMLKPWISAGYSYGSGDGDPNNGRHSTFFQLLPTPRQYARFPFYNMMNNEDLYATLNVRPLSKLSCGAKATLCVWPVPPTSGTWAEERSSQRHLDIRADPATAIADSRTFGT